jgi:hypothetical protein
MSDGNIYINQPLLMEIAVVDRDGNAIDISEATTIEMKLSIAGGSVITKVASLKEGSDSIAKYQYAAGDINALGLGAWWVVVDGVPCKTYCEQVYAEGQG